MTTVLAAVRPSTRTLLGPAFVVAVAYVDPGTIATNVRLPCCLSASGPPQWVGVG